MWLGATEATIVLLFRNERSTHAYETPRDFLQAGYVGALLWYLSRTGPPAVQLPELHPQVLSRWRYGAWVPALGIALLFARRHWEHAVGAHYMVNFVPWGMVFLGM